ncbi:MAG: 23S rRNA (uridine(2552)-2'-O)-methyltransferase [Thaumarchaeota archaeon 13_1_40CM_3_50_5]|nr:MAG: 23S rRNA (uridine(2552)-2'-O)-methyltransferase [Thaumarchaeota archaeon 13_1_40CM_4_48_7]OLC26460.1 MAG: 23S rRNA (uridine(2552)-2'-O)-methyltransferase [Candidatus Nitrososphaera sp. 13_1_40CM_48_12]OLC83964.1 MAG: 23S rRNA (uridine(2552)-2'-O)-methyltransferase [Thaumarchaeota archaeon 13_1_40CM_3_50_5]
MRLADARKDQYRRLAKDQGYRARSAYKLLQLNNSYHIIKKGSKVVDLGCAPGGWLQVVTKEVGQAGKVVGIDLKPVESVAGATVLKGSIEDVDMFEKIVGILGSKADVILSDLAPNVSGLWDIDHARQISLSATALGFARQVLRVGGSAVFKVFEGDLLNEFRADLKTSFGRVLLNKPSASRQESSELYIVCLDFKQ